MSATAPATAPGFDRRPVQRGDRKLADLLAATDALLRESSLDDVTVGQIAARAGLSRSSFYFYFHSKEACVAALGADLLRGVGAAAELMVAEGDPPDVRVRRCVDGILDAWAAHRHLYRAMLDARDRSTEMQAYWDATRAGFVAPVAAMIERDRTAGLAPPEPDAALLANALLELNDRLVRDLVTRPDDEPAAEAGAARERVRAVLVAVWLRSVYGRVDGGPHLDPDAHPDGGA